MRLVSDTVRTLVQVVEGVMMMDHVSAGPGIMAQIVQRNPLTDNVTPTVPTVGAAEQARETVPRVTLDQLRGLLANDGANADLLAAETGVSADDLRAIARTLTLPADVPR